MKNPLVNWWPNDKQRQWAEKFLYPSVLIMKHLTSWYSVLVWAFLLPYLNGQSIIYSAAISLGSSLTAYLIWREPKNNYYEG